MKPSVLLGVLVAGAACVHSAPSIEGAAPTPATPASVWTPPAAVTAAAARGASEPSLSPAALQQLSLAQIVDLALRNSPATHLSWAQARAAADVYGSSTGKYYPTLSAGIASARQLTLAAAGRTAIERTTYGPSLSLSYTVLDFGARSGTIDVARQTAIAADLAHNATVQNTILSVESAAFSYLATRAERDAQRSSVALAQAALDAANERHRVGLATIADVLQAQTAFSQAQLQLETLEGGLQIARGTLAVAMGLPANAPYDVPDVPAADSARFVTQSVDSLIAYALRSRPELAQTRAQAEAAASQIRVARSGYLPTLAFTGTTSNQGSNVSTFAGHSYSLNFGVSIPVFNGFSNQYDVASASANYQAALARTEQTKQQVIQQVFTSYYTLRTATDRVHTSRDLLASATQSETVARERYKEGVGSIVDLLVAQSALANARAQDIDSRWQWRTALAQLSHDVGVLDARGDSTFTAPMLPAQGTK